MSAAAHTSDDTESNAGQPASKSLLTLLTEGVAAINPDKVRCAEHRAPRQAASLGRATDSMKRFLGFIDQTAETAERLGSEAMLHAKALEDVGVDQSQQLGEWYLAMMNGSGGRREQAQRLVNIEKQIETTAALARLAGEHLNAEARVTFSLKDDAEVVFGAGWRVYLRTDIEPQRHVGINVVMVGPGQRASMTGTDMPSMETLFGGEHSMPGDMPGLAEVLEAAMRDARSTDRHGGGTHGSSLDLGEMFSEAIRAQMGRRQQHPRGAR